MRHLVFQLILLSSLTSPSWCLAYPPPTNHIEFTGGATVVPIEGTLGEGGFGTVFAYSDPKTGKAKALKVFGKPELFGRAKRANDLLYAGVKGSKHFLFPEQQVRVRVVSRDYGEIEGPAYVFPRMDGNLTEYAPYLVLTATSSPLSVDERIQVTHGVGSFLGQVVQELSKAGIVHSDIKLENILVRRKGRTLEFKLADHDVAESMKDFSPAKLGVSGTPSYQAPECFAGSDAARKVDGSKADGSKVDLFAASVAMYRLFTGRHIGVPAASTSVEENIGNHRKLRAIQFATEATFQSQFLRTADEDRRDALAIALASASVRSHPRLHAIDAMIESGMTYRPGERHLHAPPPAPLRLSLDVAALWDALSPVPMDSCVFVMSAMSSADMP